MGNPHGRPTEKARFEKNLRICVDFQEINKVTLTNRFLAPFADEILNEVARHECYSFIGGF